MEITIYHKAVTRIKCLLKCLGHGRSLISASFLPFPFSRDLVFILFLQGLPSETQNFLLFLQTKKDHPYTWRIELAKTEKYWDGWFRGLSNLFLSCPIPKLLLLAGKCVCACISQFGLP